MRVLTAQQAEDMFGITREEVERIDRDACEGVLPGEPGPIMRGRPLKFGQPLKMVGYKDVPEAVEAVDRRAESLGMTRSDYLRDLVRRDLASA